MSLLSPNWGLLDRYWKLAAFHSTTDPRVSTAIDCECPNHLSALVSGLVAFEQYSRECESRDEQDAAVHRRLADGTAEARSQMENLLVELCEYEGISV